MKKRVLAVLVCLVFLLCIVPVGFAPKAEAAAFNAQQTLDQRRDAAFNAMLDMATILWRATEDVTYTFGTSTVNIKAGRLYRGIPYTYARGTLDTFLDFAGQPDTEGTYEISGLTTEHLDGSSRNARIGNDCSGAAQAAYGAVGASVKIAKSSNVTPANGYLRVALDKYTTPPDDDTNANDSDITAANGEQVMYSVYAETLKADLWVCSGHTMMNNYVNVVYAADGSIDGEASTAVVVHQTPGYIRNESYYISGTYSEANYGEKVYKCFGVNEKKTFKWLYDNGYMPVTCAEFVDVNAFPKAVTLTDTETEYGFHNILEGTLRSNRMINSVTVTIQDEKGNLVQQATGYSVRETASGVNADLEYDLSQLSRENPEKLNGYLNLALLGIGSYHCTITCRLRTGEILTARDFDFALTEEDLWDSWVDNSNLSGADAACPVCKTAVTWQALSAVSAATTLEAGHYYLTEDLTNTGYYNIKSGEVCVHLNGHNITSESMAFRVGGGTLKLMGNGKVSGGYVDETSKYGSTIYLQSASAKLYLYGGCYGHSTATTQATVGMNIVGAYVAMYDGATICRMNGAKGTQVNVRKGTFEMFGGLITDGDNRKNYGGNVKVGDASGDAASFIMHGGIISDGKAKYGGNIHVNGENASFTMYDGLIYLGVAGYISKDGLGGNIYMPSGGNLQLDGTVSYGKSYEGGGNLYIKASTVNVGGTVENGNGDVNVQSGKSGGNIYVASECDLTITGTVRDNLQAVSYGGNIFASGSQVTVDGGTVSGGSATSRGGNVYLASSADLLVENGGVIKDGTAVNGGNIAGNSATSVITLENATVTGGSAETGENIRLLAALALNITDSVIDGGVYAYTGSVNLYGNTTVVDAQGAKFGGISFTTGKLTLDKGFVGKAAVKWKTAYGVGDTVADTEGVTTGFYTGNVYLTGEAAVERLMPTEEGRLQVAEAVYTVIFQYADGTLIDSKIYCYGDTVIPPADPESQTGEYQFLGWDKQITACEADAVYTAVFGTAYPIGDYTKDKQVTNEDVVYLLWYTLFPKDYPIDSEADFTKDARVTNEDVVYLLWYTLFPEDYPLEPVS